VLHSPRSSNNVGSRSNGGRRKSPPLFFRASALNFTPMIIFKSPKSLAREAPPFRGFSVIELLVVVAIILIIASLAIPQLMRARIAANEAAAGEAVRTITTASVAYSSMWGNGYPPALAALGGSGSGATCNSANLIDPVVASAPNQKSGFSFAYLAVGAAVIPPASCASAGTNSYLLIASPILNGISGIRSFCADEAGTIHYDTTGAKPLTQAACEALPQLQ
jgi:type IV pilus assembly protein PilA